MDRPSPVRATVSPTTATTQSASRAARPLPAIIAGVGRGRHEQRGSGLAVREGRAGRVGHQPADVRAAGVGDGPVRRGDGAEAVEHGRSWLARVAVGQPVDLAGGAGPVAELGVRVVGVRADDRNGSAESRWRRPTVGAGGQAAARGSVPSLRSSTSDRRATSRLRAACSAAADDLGLPLRIRAAGVLEQAELELEGQDAADGVVDERPRRRRLGRRPPGPPSKNCGVVMTRSLPASTATAAASMSVGADLLLPDHPADVVPVGDQRAGEAPLALAAPR